MENIDKNNIRLRINVLESYAREADRLKGVLEGQEHDLHALTERGYLIHVGRIRLNIEYDTPLHALVVQECRKAVQLTKDSLAGIQAKAAEV